MLAVMSRLIAGRKAQRQKDAAFRFCVDPMIVSPDVPVVRLDAGERRQSFEARAVIHHSTSLFREERICSGIMQQHKGARQEREVLATNVNAVPICLIRARSVEDQPPTPVQLGFWQGKRV